MLFRRLHHDQLAQSSYLIACQATGEAIVLDPLRDSTPYLAAAQAEGVRITFVTETHVHADFLSGATELARQAGAVLLLSGEGTHAASYRRDAFPAARWLRAGDQLHVGRVRLDVMHVPGHTPEHLAFLITDEETSAAPVGMLSGDFLFVGDVGRPDLLERSVGATGTMEASARELYASLQRLEALPDFVQLWPGHGAGSACGKALGALPQSTLGYERRSNWAFAVHSVEEFVAQVLAGQPDPPTYFARMKRLNATGAPPLPSRAPLADPEVAAAARAGAQLVDLRPAAAFAAGHLRHAINVPLGRSFLRLGAAVLLPDRDLVLLAPANERAAALQAVRDLGAIGLDRVLGILPIERAAELTGEPEEALPSVPAVSLGGVAAGTATVLDVRDRSEWAAGHIPGARHLPLQELPTRLEELRGAGPLLVHCQGGTRSAVAASVLRAAGFTDVFDVVGGYAAWERAGHTPERDG